MYYENKYHYNPYSYHNRVGRYIPMDELPFLQRIARMMYVNSMSGGYHQPKNSLMEFLKERYQNMQNNNGGNYEY